MGKNKQFADLVVGDEVKCLKSGNNFRGMDVRLVKDPSESLRFVEGQVYRVISRTDLVVVLNTGWEEDVHEDLYRLHFQP